jgi:hypothetical protein
MQLTGTHYVTSSRENTNINLYEISILERHIIWWYENPKGVEIYFKRIQ